MYPDKFRMGTDFVYVTPPLSLAPSYTYREAVEYCASSHNAFLPTIQNRLDAFHIGVEQEIDQDRKFIRLWDVDIFEQNLILTIVPIWSIASYNPCERIYEGF